MATKKPEQQPEQQEEIVVSDGGQEAESAVPEIICMCACHEHPDIYETSDESPCPSCGHVNSRGKPIGPRQGWKPSRRGT